MEIIETPIYVKLTKEERDHLFQSYLILNKLYQIAEENDCEYVGDICGNGYGKFDIQSAECVVQMLCSAEKLEICN